MMISFFAAVSRIWKTRRHFTRKFPSRCQYVYGSNTFRMGIFVKELSVKEFLKNTHCQNYWQSVCGNLPPFQFCRPNSESIFQKDLDLWYCTIKDYSKEQDFGKDHNQAQWPTWFLQWYLIHDVARFGFEVLHYFKNP